MTGFSSSADHVVEGGDLVLLAVLVSRVEALVVASVLEAAGIHVHAGGVHHASVEVNSLALGGHRLCVPRCQHRAASELLLETRAGEEWSFSFGLRRAVLKFLALWAGLQMGIWGLGVAIAVIPVVNILAVPLTIFSVPVNPQGRGDYFLHKETGILVD